MSYCAGRTPPNPEAYTACAGGNTMYLGPNPDGTHNADWKFVIAHELGHNIQAMHGATIFPDYDESTAEAACRCDHVPLIDRSHCMNSREALAGVENEGYAHGVAAATWNHAASSACSFIYYKERYRNGAAPQKPPVAFDCAAPVKYMENTCLAVNRGVEWDWMNWQRAMDQAPVPVNNADFAAVYVTACGGTCGGYTVPTVPQLKIAANNLFGIGAPQALTFTQKADQFGTDH